MNDTGVCTCIDKAGFGPDKALVTLSIAERPAEIIASLVFVGSGIATSVLFLIVVVLSATQMSRRRRILLHKII